MKNVYLFCAAGMSTSLLVNKMKEAATALGCDYHIEAFPVAEAGTKGQEADILLLGPQVRFQLNQVKSQVTDKPVEAIDMLAYGMMDGKKVVEHVIEVIGK